MEKNKMSRVLYLPILVMLFFSSCSTYVNFEVMLKGDESETMDVIRFPVEASIVDKWYYCDGSGETSVVFLLSDSSEVSYSVLSPMFRVGIGERYVYEKFVGYQTSPVTDVELLGVYDGSVRLRGNVRDGDVIRVRDVYVNLPEKYISWFTMNRFLTLYDLGLLAPYVTYTVKGLF